MLCYTPTSARVLIPSAIAAAIWSRVTAGDITLDPIVARRLLIFCEQSPERNQHLRDGDIERLRDALEQVEKLALARR